MEELQTLVIYDIPDDRIRNRLGEICKDYGLKRIQYSGFVGPLSRNKREELCLKLKGALGDERGKLLVQPICEKDMKSLFAIENKAPKPDGAAEAADAPASGQ